MKKKIAYKILLFSLVLLLFNCGEDKKIVEDNSPVISVVVNQIKSIHNNPFLSVSGKIKASNSASLSTKMMGYVNKVNVKVGDKVRKGQLLVSINNADLQAKRAQANALISEATATFQSAEKDYNRYKNLYSENSASQKEMDDMTANYDKAKARLEATNQMKNEINAQFAYSNIIAPFSGTITSKNVEVGNMANPGVSLINIETSGDFEVIAMVPESEISSINKGISVDVLVKSINEKLSGKVTEISTSAKNTGGQYLVIVDLDNTEANIMSGMYATVQFPIERKATSTMVLIPKDAIITKGQLSGIYTVSQSNTAFLRWLRLGRTYGDDVEVLSGLNADEAYIVSAEGKLFNGAKVSIH